VLSPLGLGDFLTALPADRALARAYPRHRRLLAAPAALAPLAQHTGLFHDLLATSETALEGVDTTPDVAVNLEGAGPGSHRVLLATRPRRFIAFAHPSVRESDGQPMWKDGEYEVARWSRLLTESGIPADPEDLSLPPPARPVPVRAWGATLLHPGAGSGARRWPPERWARIARAEESRGRCVFVTGSAAEFGLARFVARRAGLPPSASGPPPGRQRHRVLWAGLTGDPDADALDRGLLTIAAEQVITALRKLPDRRTAATQVVA